MTQRPRLTRETRRIGPWEPMPAPAERPRLGDAALAAYLRARGAASAVGSLGGLDGYLAAVVVGPRFVDPRVWLADLAGEAAMMAPEGTEGSLAVQAVVHHFNRISITLSDAPGLYRPRFDTDHQGRPDPLLCCSGKWGSTRASRSPSGPGRR